MNGEAGMHSRRYVDGVALALVLLLSACADRMMNAGLFAARVEDTLGRPLEGVQIRIFNWEAKDDERSSSGEVTLATATTNRLGLAFAAWKAVDLPTYDPRETPDYAAGRMVELEKPGYIGYSTDNLWHRYTLAKVLTANDFEALSSRSGADLHTQVRELLAGQFLDPMTDTTRYWLPHANRVRAILVALIHERHVARQAMITLARLGFPEDIEVLVAQRDAIRYRDQEEYDLCLFVLPALLTPQSPEAWAFLNECLHGADPGGGIDAALLDGSERARQMLREYQSDNPVHREAVKQALEQFGNPPAPVTGATPEALVAAVRAFLSTESASVAPILFVEPTGQLALASFGAPECRCGYGATLHRVGDHWVLRRLGIDWIQ